MAHRDSNQAKAQEVLEICESGGYTTLLAGKQVGVQFDSIPPAVFVPASETETLNFPEKGRCGKLSVTTHSAITDILTSAREHPGRRLGVLNFASSLHPGGGFLTGAMAQEEALCHASTLYLQLKNCAVLYEENQRNNSDVYTDNMAVSKTWFFKNDAGMLLPKPVETIVVTSAAVNQNKIRDRGSERVSRVMRKRMHKILQLFIREGAEALILGAFGCGVFRNDAKFIAEVWKEELEKYGGYFEEVLFSVKGAPDSYNVKAFTSTFGPCGQ